MKDFREGLQDAWADLFGLKEKSTGMRKQIYQPAEPSKAGEGEGEEDGEAAGKEASKAAGGGALVVVKTPQQAWERLAEKLRDAPIIQEILKASSKLADTELGRQAKKLRTSLQDRVEDAREMWETSQNPLVYRLSSFWDDMTSETDLGIALREIRRADPDFVVEDWVQNLAESFLPQFFRSYLQGDLKALTPYLSEGMRKQLAEEFRLRKAEGLVLDPHVLEISNAEVIQAKMHDHQPVLVLGVLLQHINCVRNREGQVVEGKEDEVRASFYLLLFVREFNEEQGALEWKITERYLGFSQPFI
jgi:import inner membrane translocase subunit TIM44